MSHMTGLVRANLAAGDGNVQQNSAALASTPGHSRAGVEASQFSEVIPANFYQALSARIEAGALESTLGIVMLNQSSGAGNAQFNGAAIAIGGLGADAFVQLSSEALGAQSASDTSERSGPSVNSEGVFIDPEAFSHARGVMMINQAAGNNNATANSFTLSVGP